MNHLDQIFSNILSYTRHQPIEYLNINDAFGHTLAEDIISPHAYPLTDEAAKTGIAIMLSNLKQLPVSLRVVGISSHATPYTDKINDGEAVLLHKHSPLPPETDAIIALRDLELKSTPTIGDDIIIEENLDINLGDNIAMKGIDFDDNEIVLHKGSVINSRAISIAATMHVPWLKVRRLPRIGILSIGSELRKLGEPGSRDSVIPSSSHYLRSTIKSCGGQPIDLGVAPDNIDEIKYILSNIDGLDMVITTGGTSLSAKNLLLQVLTDDEDSIVHKEEFCIEDSESVFYGLYHNVPFISLPGSLCCNLILSPLLIKPIIFYLSGGGDLKINTKKAILGRNLDNYDMRYHFLHSKIHDDENGHLIVEPMSGQDRIMLSNIYKCNSILMVDHSKPKGKAGDIVDIICLSETSVFNL